MLAVAVMSTIIVQSALDIAADHQAQRARSDGTVLAHEAAISTLLGSVADDWPRTWNASSTRRSPSCASRASA
jgi:hypothetical protein